MRSPLAVAAPVVLSLAIFAACGPATQPPVTPPTSTSTSSSTGGGPAAEDALCDRVCAVQLRCGGEPKACRGRCLSAARVLMASVMDQMVSCVEHKAPKECEAGDVGYQHRREIVSDCTSDAMEARREDAKANVALFAKTWCDGAATCGSPDATSASQCLGASQGAIMDKNSDWVLYGSIRPTKVDEITLCIKAAPCADRPSAAELVQTCVLETLAKAAEP